VVIDLGPDFLTSSEGFHVEALAFLGFVQRRGAVRARGDGLRGTGNDLRRAGNPARRHRADHAGQPHQQS
jgi:hypothetical protein